MARSRYGRLGGALSMLSASRPHLALPFRKRVAKRGTGKNLSRVLEDRLRLGRQLDLVMRQTPEDRRDGRIDQRELVRQEIRLHLEEVRTLHDGIRQYLAQLRQMLLVLHLDLLQQRVPVPLDAIKRQPELSPGHRVDRHQRRMREALIQVLDDHTRVIEHEIAVDERGDRVVRVEIQQILMVLARLHIYDIDADALLGENNARAVAPRIVRRGKQRHYGTSARHDSAPAVQPAPEPPSLYRVRGPAT